MSLDPTSAPPPAGWYPDPAGGVGLRWWDGTGWTGAERPAGQAQDVSASDGSPQDDPRQHGSHPSWRRLVAVVLIVALVVALGASVVSVWRGASQAVRLDTAAIEREVARVLSQQLGTTVTVECPDDIRLEAGASFTCTTASADGALGAIEVSQDDDQGDVTWRVES